MKKTTPSSDCIDFSCLRTEVDQLMVRVNELEAAVVEAHQLEARIEQLKREGVVPLKEYRQLQRLLDRL